VGTQRERKEGRKYRNKEEGKEVKRKNLDFRSVIQNFRFLITIIRILILKETNSRRAE
jgi:hypothetical protein